MKYGGEALPDTTTIPEIKITPTSKRVRALLGGVTLVDTQNAILVKEGPRPPRYYVPIADITQECFTSTPHTTVCPYKGSASYWTIAAGGKSVENAAWAYRDPAEIVGAIKGYLSLEWAAADQWLEEDEVVIVHPRDPQVRVDVIESHRRVRVEVDGVVLAETRRARFLFETGKVTRYYIPRDDVAMDFLEASDKGTACPYKGAAKYFSVRTPTRFHADLVWYYTDPLDECLKIKDMLCFYNEKVDLLSVDGPSET